MRDYNFFEPYQQKSSGNIRIKSAGFLSALLIIIIAGVSIGIIASNKVIASENAQAEYELQQLQASPGYAAADALKKSIDALDSYDKNAEIALERLGKGDLVNTDFLTHLSSIMPENTKILSMEVTKTYANFRIHTPNLAVAAELLDSLDQSGLFVHTNLNAVESSGEIGYEADIFTIMKAGE